MFPGVTEGLEGSYLFGLRVREFEQLMAKGL